MNKDIEELLKEIKYFDGAYVLEGNNRNLLLSYIEQLENNRDKAIEYIANVICDEKARVRHDLCGKDIDFLINILKGDSDDTR